MYEPMSIGNRLKTLVGNLFFLKFLEIDTRQSSFFPQFSHKLFMILKLQQSKRNLSPSTKRNFFKFFEK